MSGPRSRDGAWPDLVKLSEDMHTHCHRRMNQVEGLTHAAPTIGPAIAQSPLQVQTGEPFASYHSRCLSPHSRQTFPWG
jgi:hypothetical protein